MIEANCMINRTSLPALPCSYESCPWFVNNEDYANCFWVVAECMSLVNRAFSEKEIAEFEGITEIEVMRILALAIKKIRTEFRTSLMEI